MRTEQETDAAVRQYSNMIRRICLYHLKNHADTEDVFQNVFLKYLLYEGSFSDAEHEKAWFIRVTINACKDHLRSLFRRGELPLELLADEAAELDTGHQEVLEAVLSLKDKYKDAIYLHYFEGYSAAETAALLGSKESTVFSLLSRGRAMLREKLGGEELD